MKKILMFLVLVLAVLLSGCKEEVDEKSALKQIQNVTETMANNAEENEKEALEKTKNEFPLEFVNVDSEGVYDPTFFVGENQTVVNYKIKSYAPVKGYYQWISDDPIVPNTGEVWILVELEIENKGKEVFNLSDGKYYLKSEDGYKFEEISDLKSVLVAHQLIEDTLVELPSSVNPLQIVNTYALFAVNEELFNKQGINFVLEEINKSDNNDFGFETEEVLIKLK